MRTTRIFLAAAAVTLLSTAVLATPPSASQVSVAPGAEMHKQQARLRSLFSSPEEFAMFRVQIHQATHGMDRAHKKAYRRAQFQKIRAMNDSERASWRRDLDAQWAALPADRQAKMERKMERHSQKHEARVERRNGDQEMNQAPQQL
jgi:hypothetical protein